MPHIALNAAEPGIRGLLRSRPAAPARRSVTSAAPGVDLGQPGRGPDLPKIDVGSRSWKPQAKVGRIDSIAALGPCR